MKKLISSLLLSFVVCVLQAQIKDPVKFKTEFNTLSDTEAEIVFTAAIDKGWHVYSTELGDGGPISATFNVDKTSGIELLGKLKPVGKEVATFDKLFEMKVRYFENTAKFIQKVKLTGGAYEIEGYLEYGACDDESCLPPTEVPFKFSGVAKTANAAAAKAEQPEKKEVEKKEEAAPVVSKDTVAMMELVPATTTDASTGIQPAVASGELWKPVISELQALGEEHTQGDMSWIYIFVTGFLGGLLALFTPCVWPIIPMTVSFFLKRSKDKKKGIRDAWTYGASIVVIYVALGLAITLIFGASALNALSTNAIFNILFFLMLVVFAASFFGAFEITLPSKWSNAVDSKAESTTGLLSIFLMAFTLSLVSFSCTGPIIGFLLVQVSTTGSIVAPAIGMLGFAIALALPFTLFALFPSWLKSMPKSGGWMNVIKVTLGFLELAFALKFLSVADLAYGWRLLDRETFLALWIVIFALLGFYLLGKIKFPHDDDDNKVGVTRFFMALVSLAFAVYMVPGLWGAPLKAVSAFAPPMQTQDFNLYKNEVHAKFDDYDLGMEYARLNGKPVMLDFTGYGCVNCRKMEAAVLLTLFLCEGNETHKAEDGPVVLIAMHGDSTASSVADVVNSLAGCGNTYAYDMPLDKDMQQACDELKAMIQELDRGQGILLLYDMGSLRTMAEVISKETGVQIRTVAVPGTLIAVDCSRKAASASSLEELHEDAMGSCRDFYTNIAEPEGRSHHKNTPVIITLCMTGEGGAVQMKNYLEKNAGLNGIQVIPLSISDRKALLNEVNRLREEHEIRCVIGTYDPGLHGIPFISVVKLFETPADKLDMLLTIPESDHTPVNYEMIFSYLSSQMPALDIKKLRKSLPRALAKIKRISAEGLDQNQELGLFLHIACAIDRLQNGEAMPEKGNRQGIISRNKRLYNDLREILSGLEETFDIRFSDDELAYMIAMVKKL